MPTLPDLQTDDGSLIRLLLAESLTPAYSSYVADTVRTGMKAMKATVDNRLKNNPAQFNAKGATTYRDIITAPGQFQGFSTDDNGNVHISQGISDRIDAILNNANAEAGPAFGVWTDLVNNATNVVAVAVDDPFSSLPSQLGGVDILSGCFSWKTEGSSSPGSRFVEIPDSNGGLLAGNRFYALSKG